MPQIPTTAGPMEIAELGKTMTHEHAFDGSEALRTQFPHAYDRDEDIRVIIEETKKIQTHGVETIVDPTCMDLGRDVRLNIEVTEATGMRYVMSTGIYGQGYTFLPMFIRRDLSQIVDLFVHDIEVGIQGTEIKAGFLKCAADAPGMQPDIVALHEGIAEASLRTNTPIMAHSNPVLGGSQGKGVGLDQMKIFTDKGVDPSMVQIAHVGDTDDLDYIEALLDTGCYIGLDRYGLPILTREQRNQTLIALVERGYGDRIMIGQDSVIRMDGIPPGQRREMMPDWYPTFIFDEIIPELTQMGVSEAQVDKMLGANVHAWLTP
jgi:phosphotriesterase-related protein